MRRVKTPSAKGRPRKTVVEYTTCQENYAKRLKPAHEDKARRPETSWMDSAASVHEAILTSIEDAPPLWLRCLSYFHQEPLVSRKLKVFSECLALKETRAIQPIGCVDNKLCDNKVGDLTSRLHQMPDKYTYFSYSQILHALNACLRHLLGEVSRAQAMRIPTKRGWGSGGGE